MLWSDACGKGKERKNLWKDVIQMFINFDSASQIRKDFPFR